MLQVQDLTAGYGAGPVLNRVSFGLAAGEVLALIGRDGVGKTALLRALTGLLRPQSGRIVLHDVAVERMVTNAIARNGMVLVPQGRGILGKLTVRDNILAGANAAGARSAMSVEEALQPFPMLQSRLDDLAGTLSGGQQQQLALARALCSRPTVLLLDEPSEGVQPNIVAEIGELIRTISSSRGVAVLLVEQNIELALKTATRCLVMEKGRIVYEGPTEELRSDAILKKYLAI